ncbi:hypothetical protein [Paracoccus sediminilitoris]|uniref:hypothetical protein n=1 Tax=Paracoccus sediminilitoris TaxID=2202419 RepID=UPI000DBA3975|nr:hypothetical protein [Paracoccus sediminilitoris]
MFNSSIKTLMLGGKAAAIAALMAGTAMAETTIISTPTGNDVLATESAMDAEASKGIVWADDYPVLEEVENNDAIIEMMIGQGFTDLKITRKGPMLTVTGQRDGVPTELVYSTANGRLVSVDGIETQDRSGDAEPSIADRAMDNVADGDGDAEMSADPSGTDTLGGTVDSGTEADADMGSTEGTDGGTDAGSESDSDTGSDGDAGGDTGGDAGADGGDSTN